MRFGLNRIACPGLSLEEFLKTASGLGMKEVELRNDIPGRRVLDDLAPPQLLELCRSHGMGIATINAVQRFDLGSDLPHVIEESRNLGDIAHDVGCPAIVFCPNNDRRDRRSPEQRFSEAVSALRAVAPELERRKLRGLLEPLGFPQCSIRSKKTAMEAIERSGADCFRVVHDTFHHRLGTDTDDDVRELCRKSLIGLVHVSGVEEPEPPEGYGDRHRVLVGPGDRTGSREQIRLLESLGYDGLCSFEPFAERIQRLSADGLREQLSASLRYITG